MVPRYQFKAEKEEEEAIKIKIIAKGFFYCLNYVNVYGQAERQHSHYIHTIARVYIVYKHQSVVVAFDGLVYT